MFNPWAYSLMALAVIVMIIARNVPRAWLWIGVGGASFVISSLYWDYGKHELHPILTLTCDSLVCLIVYRRSQEMWELGVFLAYFGSVFSSLLQLGGFIIATWHYAALLELCNAMALLWIGYTGIIDTIGANETSTFHRRYRGLHSAFTTPRRSD